LRPRVHNVLSYSVTLLVFWAVLLWRTRGVGFSAQAMLAAALWTAHFLRRTLESAFVHRYSKPRIGPGDYLTEYLYYWGFAAWIAWSVTALSHRGPALGVQAAGLVVFALAELGNARAHVILRNLRVAGSSEKRIPRGFLFEWLSCPHYLCEILSWAGFNLATQTLSGLAFMLVGAGILGAWAHARHVAYKKEFGAESGREPYPTKRRALLPGVF
jgi:very-long-chain enoyl-CoA reductase